MFSEGLYADMKTMLEISDEICGGILKAGEVRRVSGEMVMRLSSQGSSA